MAIEVFNRYENKYMVGEKKLARIQSRISDYMELDAYNKNHETYSIANLYYDTPDHHLIRTSLAKPGYKEKLHVRAYGVPDSDARAYVELKKKINGLVNKRRSAMELQEAYHFLGTGQAPEPQAYMNRQVIGEIRYVLERHQPKPALYLAYERRAYFGVGQHDLRVSFDTGIRTRRTDLRLEYGDYGEPLLEKGTWLMEIKASRSIPVWLCRLLLEYEIYPTSFSKYGTEYKRMLGRTMPSANWAVHPEPTPHSINTRRSA